MHSTNSIDADAFWNWARTDGHEQKLYYFGLFDHCFGSYRKKLFDKLESSVEVLMDVRTNQIKFKIVDDDGPSLISQ